MAFGPGKYDELCTEARQKAEAVDGLVLLVFNGKFGHGFSVQATPELTAALPGLLRRMAEDIERSFNQA